MYVCICNAVTEAQIRALAQSCAGMAELRARTGLGGDCGRCLKSAVRLLRGTVGEDVPRAARRIPLSQVA